MSDSQQPAPGRFIPLSSKDVTSFLKKMPQVAALPVAALAADMLAPEVAIGLGALIFGVEQAYRSGKLQSFLDGRVAAGQMPQGVRDGILTAARRLDAALPLRAADVVLLATLVPDLDALAPLVAKVPQIRTLAVAVRRLVSGKGLIKHLSVASRTARTGLGGSGLSIA